MRLKLRTALYQAVERQTNVEATNVKFKADDREETINIYVRPILQPTDTERGFVLVLLEPVGEVGGATAAETAYRADEPINRQLEDEIVRLKTQLRATSEQYEIHAEEFKASTEEQQAMNEELRASTEELETSKEELQSVNEELSSVNQELKVRIEEVSQTGSYLNNLINSTEIATVFLDRAFRVQLFTPAAGNIFNLIQKDIGRPLSDITHRLENADIVRDAETVLKTLQAVEREIRTTDNLVYTMRVLPYRTAEDRISGVVVIFFDITSRRRAEESVELDLTDTQTLHELSARLVTVENEQTIYDEIMTAAIRLTRSEAGTVQIYDEKAGELVILATSGFAPDMTEYFERVCADGETSCGISLANGTRTFVDYDESNDLAAQMHVAAGYHAAQSTPLVSRAGKPIGMVSTHWNESGHRPTARELRFLDLLARQAADLIEQRRAERVIRESEEKYRNLFDSMDEGYILTEVIFDADENPVDIRYLEANPAAVKMTGSELVGKTTRELDPNFEAHWVETWSKVAKTGIGERHELTAAPLEAIYSVYAFKVGAAEEKKVAAVYQDITARRRHEANLSFLAEVSRDLVQVTNINETMSSLCAKIGGHFKVARVVFAELGEDETTSVIRHEWRQDGLPTLKEAAELKNLLTHKIEAAQRSGEISYIKDVAAELRDAALTLTTLGIVSLLGAPLVRDEKLHLYLSILDSRPREWRADEIELMRELTGRIRTRLESARAEAALRESEAKLSIELADTQLLQRISSQMIVENDASALYRQILEAARGIMRADSASIQKLVPERNELLLLAHYGFAPESAKHWEWVNTTEKSSCALAMSSDERIVVADVEEWDFIAGTEDLRQYRLSGIRATQSTRLISREGHLVGMISTHWHEPPELSERELSRFDVLARQVADLIEQRQAEQALRESEERLRLAASVSDFGIHDFDVASNRLYWSPELKVMHELAPDADITFDAMIDFIHPDDRKRVEREMKAALDPKGTGEFEQEFRIYRRNTNETRYLYNRSQTVFEGKGKHRKPVRNTGVVLDVTARREMEEAVRESEERFRLLIESASDYAIFTLTRDGFINTWNTGAEKVFGWTETEAVGQPGEIIFTPEDRAKGAPEQEIITALKGGRAPDERYHLRKDGSRFYVSGVMTLLKTSDGDVQGFAKIARDMTELIEAEKALRGKEMLQKLVGAQEDERKRIARDLHDELGQQLTALRLKLDAARKLCENDSKLCGKIDEIETIAKSIDNGVDFLAWELRPAALDDLGLVAALTKYVEQWSHHSGVTADFLASSLKRTRFAPEIETNLYRIVQEALNNTHKHAKAKSVEVVLEKRDGLIILLVEDNGKGFNPKDKKKRQQGMGLTGMKERAILVGGTLEIESAPGKGTTVFVRVPASTEKRKKSDGK